LTAAEFEWCIISYLKYSDRCHARRLFAALDRRKTGEVGLRELMNQQSQHSAELMSMVEFRRVLLDRHTSLARAFRELEDYVEMEQGGIGRFGAKGSRVLRAADFTKAASFFGLEPHQATHLFCSIDADNNGQLTFDEFVDALTTMPREVLLHDFRQRLVARYETLANAFSKITHSTGVRLVKADFVSSLARLSINDHEAEMLFQIADYDESGDVSIDELREAVREVAPHTDLESFWKRFAAEWPDIASLASRKGEDHDVLRQASALLSDLLPLHVEVPCSPRPRDAGLHTAVLTADAFDALAARLDVSRRNAAELWTVIVAAAPVYRPRTEVAAHLVPQASLSMKRTITQHTAAAMLEDSIGDGACYIEDFLEQLHLWAANPLALKVGSTERCSGQSWSMRQEVLQISATARARISALKAELEPRRPQDPEQELEQASGATGTQAPPSDPSRGTVRRRSKPKLPWLSHFSVSRAPSPALL
jgi:Ca2+-binding EF-hand superfamily protein